MTEPWARAVADADDEEVPPDLLSALRDEIAALWRDLDTAIDQTIKGRFTPPDAWSMHALGLASRIIVLSRMAGATPWEQITYNRLLDGTYQGLMTAAGIEHAEPGEDELRQMREWTERQREAARRS